MNRLTVKTPDKKEYDIVLDRGFEALGDEIDRLSFAGRRALIVSDTNVAPLYIEKLETVLNGKNIVIHGGRYRFCNGDAGCCGGKCGRLLNNENEII